MAKSTYQTTKIFDLDVFSSDYAELLNYLVDHLQTKKTLLTILTPNPEQIVLSRKNHAFLDHLQSADILIPDGIGLVGASALLSTRGVTAIRERITGRQLAADVLALAQARSLSVIVIGGKHYGLDTAATESELSVNNSDGSQSHVYWTEGYADIRQPSEKEETALLSLLAKKKPAIVFVAFGAPFQEAANQAQSRA
jgi:N-acetylglucosaminyldiphosphoundecaprenol N-acetyl-beta-D-mannosaminyltransferase